MMYERSAPRPCSASSAGLGPSFSLCALALLHVSLARAEPLDEAKPSAAASEVAGVLPIASAANQAQELDAALGRRLAERGLLDVAGPLELRARLRAVPEVARALTMAAEAVERAERAGALMERRAATAAAHRAIELLRDVEAEQIDPRLAARAHVALGLAALLEPADPLAARAAFRTAFAIDASFAPDERRLAPRVLEILARARASARPPLPPDSRTCARLARFGRVPRLFWISATPAGSPADAAFEISVQVYDTSGTLLARTVRRAPREESAARIAETIAEILGVKRRTTASAPGATSRPATAAMPRPWYRRWWVWALAAAAVAGAGTAVAVALSQQDEQVAPPPGFQFEFNFH